MRLEMFETVNEVCHHLLLETDLGRLLVHLSALVSHRCMSQLGSEVFIQATLSGSW